MTFTRFTRPSQVLHRVPPIFVRVMLELSRICECFDINWSILMAWLHKFSNFQRRNIFICEFWLYNTMSDATDDRIRELDIMIRLIVIVGSPSSSGSTWSAGWSGRWAWMALLVLLLCMETFFFECSRSSSWGWQLSLYSSCWRWGVVRPYEAVWDRVYAYYTVSAMYDSYSNHIGRMAIV
jgi:hypothetical protein